MADGSYTVTDAIVAFPFFNSNIEFSLTARMSTMGPDSRLLSIWSCKYLKVLLSVYPFGLLLVLKMLCILLFNKLLMNPCPNLSESEFSSFCRPFLVSILLLSFRYIGYNTYFAWWKVPCGTLVRISSYSAARPRRPSCRTRPRSAAAVSPAPPPPHSSSESPGDASPDDHVPRAESINVQNIQYP